jgi:sugar porter (SP) family MFS transporter
MPDDSVTGVSARPSSPASVLTGRMMLVAVVSAVSGGLYGYDTGIISGALLQIAPEFGLGDTAKSLVTASILAGAVIGALACSALSERVGRRRTLLMIAAVFVVGALGAALAPSAVALAVARLVLGFAVGGATQTAPMYVAELAPSALRGRLVLCFQVAIGVGIVVSTIAGATESISWRWSIGATAVVAAIMLGALLGLPESPRWLVAQDRDDDARVVLDRVRPAGVDVAPELAEIQDSEQAERYATTRGWRGLRAVWVRPALIVGCGIAILTQLSGIEMIIYYAPTILTDNGFTDAQALDGSVALGVTYLVMMLVGLSIIDRVGRRRLTLIMVPGTAVALFALGLVFVLGGGGPGSIPLILACLIVFMVFNAGGLQLMGWLTGSEIYPLGVRSAGTSVQAACLWGSNLLISTTVLAMINAIGVGATMWVYAAFNVVAWIFVWFRMPELTGRSLEQIEGALRDGRFAPGEIGAAPTGAAPTGAAR